MIDLPFVLYSIALQIIGIAIGWSLCIRHFQIDFKGEAKKAVRAALVEALA